MNTRLTIFNQKGGVGKTTTTLNLGAALSARGMAAVLVDLDAQAHLTSILAPIQSSAESLFAFYNEGKPLAKLAKPVSLAGHNGAQLLPAHSELIKVDSLFGKGPNILHRLREGLDAQAGGVAERPILIDCCPMLGVLSLNGVFAAHRVLIPVSTDHLAVRGAFALENTLRALEHVLKKRIERRYVLTRFDSRRRMSREIEQQLRERYGEELCRTRISEAVGLAECPAVGQDIFRYAAGSRGAKDYAQLLEELLSAGFLEI